MTIKKNIVNDMVWSSLIVYFNYLGYKIDLNNTKKYPLYDELTNLDFNIEIAFKDINNLSILECHNWRIIDNKLICNFNFDSDLSYDYYNESIEEAILLLYRHIINL